MIPIRPNRRPVRTIAGAYAIAGSLIGSVATGASAAEWRTVDDLAVAALDPARVESARTGDNSYAVKVEKRLPTGWTARIGLDVATAGASKTAREIDSIAIAIPQYRSDAKAWSTLTIPTTGWLFGGETTLRAQLDPVASSAAFSTITTKTHSLGSDISASLIGDLTLTETGIGSLETVRTWETNRSVRFEYKPTGTALVARGQIVGSDTAEVNTYFSAEQRLTDTLNVTTSLGEIESDAPVLNIGARFTSSW